MSIGEFARAARLTVKALRYYDREGLLTPDRVDPGTGYRFYAPTQLATALRIGLLRRADVSVAAIRAFLSDPAQGSEVLAAERARIERDAARAARSFALVDSLGNAVDADLPVAVHHIDAATVLWRESCAAAETLDELSRAFGLNTVGNNEVMFAWLELAVANRYDPAVPALRRCSHSSRRLPPCCGERCSRRNSAPRRRTTPRWGCSSGTR